MALLDEPKYALKEVAGGAKDSLINPVEITRSTVVDAGSEIIKGTARAVAIEGVIGIVDQSASAVKEAFMGTIGEPIQMIRRSIWDVLFGPTKLKEAPGEFSRGVGKILKRTLWNVPKHIWGAVVAQPLRAVSGTVESALTGSAIILGGKEARGGAAGLLLNTRDALRRITTGITPAPEVDSLRQFGKSGGAPKSKPAPVPEPPEKPAKKEEPAEPKHTESADEPAKEISKKDEEKAALAKKEAKKGH